MYFLFEPNAPAAVHESVNLAPIAAAHPPFTYLYSHDARAPAGWYIRDTKHTQWLPIVDEGVPENYRLELLLLMAAYP